MSTITGYAERCVRFMRSRLGALLLFVFGCTVCAFVFSSYIVPVSIIVDGEERTIMTLRSDPRDIIAQAGFALENEDELVVSVAADGTEREIEILRAFEVVIVDAGVSYSIDMADGTVAEAIAAAGIAAPDSDDIVNHSLAENIYPYIQITIDRVSYTESTATETIRFKTVKVETSDLVKGTTRIATKGEYGEKIVTSRTMYINGIAQTTEVINETVTKQAVNEIIEVGTSEPTTTAAPAKPTTASTAASNKVVESGNGKEFIDASGRAVSYSKKLTGKGTAYTAEPGAKTSTGRVVEEGIVAVDPKVIPYGSRLYITSADGRYVYGYALAADTGGDVRSGKTIVDVFYFSESKCRAFGIRDVVIYVLD